MRYGLPLLAAEAWVPTEAHCTGNGVSRDQERTGAAVFQAHRGRSESRVAAVPRGCESSAGRPFQRSVRGTGDPAAPRGAVTRRPGKERIELQTAAATQTSDVARCEMAGGSAAIAAPSRPTASFKFPAPSSELPEAGDSRAQSLNARPSEL